MDTETSPLICILSYHTSIDISGWYIYNKLHSICSSLTNISTPIVSRSHICEFINDSTKLTLGILYYKWFIRALQEWLVLHIYIYRHNTLFFSSPKKETKIKKKLISWSALQKLLIYIGMLEFLETLIDRNVWAQYHDEMMHISSCG